jgi:hypothetical protein
VGSISLRLAEYRRDALTSMTRLKSQSMFDMGLTVWDTIMALVGFRGDEQPSV